MQKRSPFSIAVRILTPIIIVLAIHALARILWVWDNPLVSLRDTRKVSPTSCTQAWDIADKKLAETTYVDCVTSLRERTFWNYSTNEWGHIQAHVASALVVVFCIAAVVGVIVWIKWAIYSDPTSEMSSEEEGDDELYVSECSDPHCRCNEHVVNDRFDTSLNRWVESDESLQETPAS